MEQENTNNFVKVREQGYLKVHVTTAVILAGIIFLASLFSGWLTQTKDIGSVQAEQKALTAIVGVNSNRITIIEECIRGLKDDTREMKSDLKEIRRDQKEFYTKIDKKGGVLR